MTELPKHYHPAAIEQACYQQWEKNGYFSCGNTDAEAYSMMLPPPNVTGTLHMGHGFQHTLMDILARYHRMMGYDTLWQPGTDHAGIATQMVVERQLTARNQSRRAMGRENFIKRVWEWKASSGGQITNQMRRLGNSVDWSRECFTMDDHFSYAVNEQFIRLFNEGLIYRGARLVNWDPVLGTAVSDLEVVNEDISGHLWHIAYPLSNGDGCVTVATTRPETLLGDAAVAVHPEDERYQHLIGETVVLPLSRREIPIIGDDYVDREFGSGCVKITPAHDFNDYEMGQRHGLELRNILTPEAYLNDQVPPAYQGLERFEARRRISADLDQEGALIQTEAYTVKVPKGDRTGAVLEPFLTEQWFVATETLAATAIQAVEDGAIRFIPENWKNTYYSWMHNIQDWCISRQLWWGHRIPAWYDAQGNVYVAHSELEARARYKLPQNLQLHRDEDVFDTWFSSALWPLATLGWPEETAALEKYYPTNVLVTGFDIIFFWVARMIMMGLKFTGEVPFREVYVTGLIRDAEGNKMSKSKGNVLDPVDLIDGISVDALVEKRTAALMQPQMKAAVEKMTRKHYPNGIEAYGTDALRFTFAALATTSRDICFDVSRMEGYRNFCNKLWNASRFVLMNVADHTEDLSCVSHEHMGVTEQWLWHRLNETVQTVHDCFQSYRFDLMAQAIYEFVWNEYCDWYVELAKIVLHDSETPAMRQQAVRFTLISVLELILRLAHPIIPFISEAIYQQVASVLGMRGEVSVMVQQFPLYEPELENEQAEATMNWLKQVVVAIRTVRAEMNIKPSVTIPVYLKNGNEQDYQRFCASRALMAPLVKARPIEWLSPEAPVPAASTAVVGDMSILIPLEGLIDIEAEKERINREYAKLEKELARVRSKLDNEKFRTNAPAEVVSKEQGRYQQLEEKRRRLDENYAQLANLPV